MSEAAQTNPDGDPCQGKLHPSAEIGLVLFNRGEYFDAHEALETVWRDERGEIRELYRGILQVAVAYHHLLRGNYAGTIKMFSRCKPWLEPFPDVCQGINLATFRRDFYLVEAQVIRLGPGRLANFNRNLLRPIEFIPTRAIE